MTRLLCRALRALPRRTSGAAALEFAVVLPVFLAVMLGILAYGIYFGAVHSAAQLAADAARASVAGLSDDERAAIANERDLPGIDFQPEDLF